jgi:hypothetical protein
VQGEGRDIGRPRPPPQQLDLTTPLCCLPRMLRGWWRGGRWGLRWQGLRRWRLRR